VEAGPVIALIAQTVDADSFMRLSDAEPVKATLIAIAGIAAFIGGVALFAWRWTR
jgi:hypothetical protein